MPVHESDLQSGCRSLWLVEFDAFGLCLWFGIARCMMLVVLRLRLLDV